MSQSPAARPSSSMGTFELHVQSVRAAAAAESNNNGNALPSSANIHNLVLADAPGRARVTAVPVHAFAPLPSPTSTIDARASRPIPFTAPAEEKSSFEDDGFDEKSIAGSSFKDKVVRGQRAIVDLTSSLRPVNHRHTSDDGPEPKTLARSMFFFGFALPILWIFGASILLLDLQYVQTREEYLEDPRSNDERSADLRVIRRTEIKWAWRSLYALVALVLSVTITLLIWAGVTGRFNGA